MLLRHEAVNNLALRIISRFADGTRPLPCDAYLAVAFAADPADHADADIVGVALRTPPYPFALGYPSGAALPALLADALAFAAPAALPGVIGEAREATAFAVAHGAFTGTGYRQVLALRAHVLTQVETVPSRGELRSATAAELPLLTEWTRAFQAEALPHDPPAQAPALDGLWIWWSGGAPVTMLRMQPFSPTSVAISLVYTPPDLRRRGYATAAVAAASARALADGRTSCALFTDLANPTSNAIYARIGYRPIADFLNLAFTPERAT
ncbi:MAG: GNAT family N-acetyltransferase [Akkermansiaceae bacterium]|jgi:hypothetical protein|nr:GNAT family N-acetyltransferase [Akkermansiaceae bacterium]